MKRSELTNDVLLVLSESGPTTFAKGFPRDFRKDEVYELWPRWLLPFPAFETGVEENKKIS